MDEDQFCQDYYQEDKHPCEYCGSTDNVQFIPNPFDADVYDDHTSHFMCEKCEYEHAQDI